MLSKSAQGHKFLLLSWGWKFIYKSRAYIRSGDFKYKHCMNFMLILVTKSPRETKLPVRPISKKSKPQNYFSVAVGWVTTFLLLYMKKKIIVNDEKYFLQHIKEEIFTQHTSRWAEVRESEWERRNLSVVQHSRDMWRATLFPQQILRWNFLNENQ